MVDLWELHRTLMLWLSFFLAAPELSNIANEAHKMAGLKSRKPETHHDLSDAATSRQERDVSELTNTIRQFCDPFRNDYDHIINIVTKAVVTDIIQTHEKQYWRQSSRQVHRATGSNK